MERGLGKDVLELQDIMDLIKKAGLIKTVWGIGPCYEKFLGRSEEPQAEVEVTDNDVCKAIT
ncbi:hypothetical protein A2U01_0056015, partial [Trifolium medium]|nr:hypothetical protein [Trifolium medium]